MDNKIELTKKVASLESKVDHLEAELSYLNKILIDCGFPQGIHSLKNTVEEILSEGLDQFNPEAF
ncbi:MAG TPA: hypothetical protein VLG76_03570 [Rhabdochlamydiaceae bacterium]|nr:hypothetical protein [Rhabdochlamydiaceae bacterium]